MAIIELGPLPDDDWLREGGEAYRTAVIAETRRLGRLLTEAEKEEIRRNLSQPA